ncbi:MAG: homoserine kinase [Bacteroides sp.]|nr:MAG: homoserine kinase [Bacteroides sp.]
MFKNDSVKVFAPATIANFSCGFDIIGFAIDDIGDTVEATIKSVNYKGNNNIIISNITGDDNVLSYDPLKNTAGITAKNFLKYLNINNIQIELKIKKNMPICSGLGSSAASAVAAIKAINYLLNTNVSYENMIPILMESEKVISGKNHADNVAPSLMGGITIIRSYNPLDIIPIKCPIKINCVIVYPLNLDLPTYYSRKILKDYYPLKDIVNQLGNLASLIVGLMKGDINIICKSMNDFIIEPARSLLIPGYNNIKKNAIDNGALGFSICGSGPSVFAIGIDNIKKIGQSIQKGFLKKNIKTKMLISNINNKGAKILVS